MSELKHWVEKNGGCFLEQSTSTNDEAQEYFKSGGKGPRLFVAGLQTAGRGRRGRHWESPSGKGLYFSLLVHPCLKTVMAPLIPLAVGLALKKALEPWELPDLLLKWPNDLYAQKKKLAGVLSELIGVGPEIEAVVIGVGINLNQESQDFSEQLRPFAASLKQILKKEVSPIPLLEKILPEIFIEIEKLGKEGPAGLVKSWEQKSGMLGKNIRIRDENGEFTGKVLGLEDDGPLKVKGEDGNIRKVLAGDVFLI